MPSLTPQEIAERDACIAKWGHAKQPVSRQMTSQQYTAESSRLGKVLRDALIAYHSLS